MQFWMQEHLADVIMQSFLKADLKSVLFLY